MSVTALEGLVEDMENRLQEKPDREISSQEVGTYVMGRLRDLDQVAYVRFASVYRSFEDVDEFSRLIKDI